MDKQIERVMDLYSRGKISPDIIEKQIQALESQKADLQLEMDGEQDIRIALEAAETELSETVIQQYVDKFEELLSEDNLELMREFLKTFISEIELAPRAGGKMQKRAVNIFSHIPAFTRIKLVLPRGFEPLLPP